ncbi:hypothetical protein Tco_0531953 [Tanacetum coccineum]
MRGASFTQGTVSSIPIVGSISPKGFLPPILLLVVIIVTVILVVVFVTIVGVVIVVAIIGVVVVVGVFSSQSSSLPYMISVPCQNYVLLPDPLTSGLWSFSVFGTMFGHKTTNSWNLLIVPVGPVFLVGLLVLAIVAACASRAAETLSATSFLMAAGSHGWCFRCRFL